MKITSIVAANLTDAWFQLLYKLLEDEEGRNIYEIDSGSYVGQKRYEFDYALAHIRHPGAKPLIPDVPPWLGVPPPVESMEYVEDYFTRYLMSNEVATNETYTYGTWLKPGIERVIEQFKAGPGTNQATISIGGIAKMPDDAPYPHGAIMKINSLACNLVIRNFVDTDNYIDPATGQRDPACLRVVDFRLDQKNRLHMFTYWRSWDLWGGFPANLAGLQLVKNYVADMIGAEDGEMVVSSKGLHLYDHCVDVARLRTGLKELL